MPIAWLRKYKANCFVGVLISIAFDLRFGMWQSMQAVVSGPRMVARLMTRQALLDKRRHVALRTMHVVARRARHAQARAKTLAALQQRHLIPVDVRGRRCVRRRGEIIVELVTRSVGERRNFRVPLAGVAQGTAVHPPVSGEVR